MPLLVLRLVERFQHSLPDLEILRLLLSRSLLFLDPLSQKGASTDIARSQKMFVLESTYWTATGPFEGLVAIHRLGALTEKRLQELKRKCLTCFTQRV